MRPTPTPIGDVRIKIATVASAGELPRAHTAADRRARVAALALLSALVGYCVFVEVRVATARKRRIDLDVVLRAAWAVRTGESPYRVTNDRGWHYNLPPLLAVLMTPLAEPPGEDRAGTVPVLVSLAIWNAVGLVVLVAGVHVIARAMEPASSDSSGWRWWAVRAVPVAACLPAIGITLNRGQVNLLLAALLCAAVAAAVRGRRFAAGVWLAGAICLKIIPAFLLVYPVWTRDRRWLAGTAVGLAVGLGLIPVLAVGPTRAAEHYADLGRSVLLPGLDLGGDQTRSDELIELYASNSQSFQVVLHRLFQPEGESPTLRQAHWLIGGALTLITLLAGRRLPETPIRTVIRFGALAVLMVAVSPASHDHYFCVNLLLVMGLVAAATGGGNVVRSLRERSEYPARGASGLHSRRYGDVRPALLLLLAGYAAACALPMIPDLRVLRDIRSPLLGSMALWLAGIRTLCRRPAREAHVGPAVPAAKSKPAQPALLR